jgi:hypothetical protein
VENTFSVNIAIMPVNRVHEKITETTFNSSGVRNTGRVLKISKDAIVAALKKTLKINPCFLAKDECQLLNKLKVDIKFNVKMDKFWSFVQKKSS